MLLCVSPSRALRCSKHSSKSFKATSYFPIALYTIAKLFTLCRVSTCSAPRTARRKSRQVSYKSKACCRFPMTLYNIPKLFIAVRVFGSSAPYEAVAHSRQLLLRERDSANIPCLRNKDARQICLSNTSTAAIWSLIILLRRTSNTHNRICLRIIVLMASKPTVFLTTSKILSLSHGFQASLFLTSIVDNMSKKAPESCSTLSTNRASFPEVKQISNWLSVSIVQNISQRHLRPLHTDTHLPYCHQSVRIGSHTNHTHNHNHPNTEESKWRYGNYVIHSHHT